MAVTANPELELQSRYVLLATLAENRRILDIGGDMQSLVTLAEAGPAELTACSDQPDTLGAQLTAAEVEGIEVVATPRPPFAFTEDAFDFIICHDFGDLLQDDERWLGDVRRILAADGYIALALANPNGPRLNDLSGQVVSSALTYEEAFEKLSDTFGTLTVFVQSPLVGNLFYDLESTEEEPDLAFDRSLLVEDVDEAGWYVLVFGPESLRRDDLTIVQVPFANLSNVVASRDAEAQLRASGTELKSEPRAVPEAPGPTVDPAALEKLESDKAALEQRIAEIEAQSPPVAQTEPPALAVAELEWLRQRVNELEGQVDDGQTLMLRERIKQLKIDRRVDQEKLNKVRQRLLAVTAENDDAQRLLPLMRERIKQLKVQERTEREKLNRVRQRLLTLEASHAETEQLLPMMRERIKQLKAERRVEQEKLNRARQNLLTTHARLEAAVGELGSVRAEMQSGQHSEASRVTELEQSVASLTAERDAAATELGLLRQRITSLKSSRADAEAKLASLREQAMKKGAGDREADTEPTRLRERIKQLKVERRTEQEKLLKVRERLLKIEGVHDAIANEHQLLTQRVAALKQERQADKGKLANLREKLLSLEADRDTAVAELQLLRERVAALKGDRETEKNKVARLREKQQTLAAEAQVARDELPILRERVRSLLQSRSDERNKTAKLRERVMALETQTQQASMAEAQVQEHSAALTEAQSQHQQALGGVEAQLNEEHQRSAAAATRVAELEQEVTRHVQDKKSFETQIKDLLEEVTQLRETSDAGAPDADALRQEKINAEALREEAARLQARVNSVEAENQGLAGEVQRLTDALHEHEVSAEQRTPPPPQPSVHDAETVIARNPLSEEQSTPPPAATATTRDAVGRPIETSLEDIEDLIAGSVPPPPTRR